MTFAWQIEHWPTVAAFAQHLARHDPQLGAWAHGVTIHHTAVPTVAQWRGRRSMEILGAFYRSRGWSAGPHLFIGPDGIWQGTPLNLPGIHAIGANETRWGVEVVGDYTRVPWSEPIRSLALGAIAALLRWRGLAVSAATVDGHRDYNKPSCPGNAIDLHAVRAELARMLSTTPVTESVTPDSTLIAPPRATAAQCSRSILSRPHGEYTEHDIASVIVPAYFRVATAVGLDPLIAIAQLTHETGNLTSWWAARPRRNPAGIGVSGRTQPGTPDAPPPGSWQWDAAARVWREGLAFPTWVDHAIPAHLGRLLAYALRDDQANAEQRALIAEALSYRPLPASYRGCAPTIIGLNGRWAVPGTGYAQAIARIANAIREVEA